MNFLINKDEYIKVKAAWNRPGFHHTAVDHIFYNALRGHDLKRGFAAVTSGRKLQSGNPWRTFELAKQEAQQRLRFFSLSGDTPERLQRRQQEYAIRIAGMTQLYGTEFTPELVGALSEVLK